MSFPSQWFIMPTGMVDSKLQDFYCKFQNWQQTSYWLGDGSVDQAFGLYLYAPAQIQIINFKFQIWVAFVRSCPNANDILQRILILVISPNGGFGYHIGESNNHSE